MILDKMNYENLLIRFLQVLRPPHRRAAPAGSFDIASFRPELFGLDPQRTVIPEELLGVLSKQRAIPGRTTVFQLRSTGHRRFREIVSAVDGICGGECQ